MKLTIYWKPIKQKEDVGYLNYDLNETSYEGKTVVDCSIKCIDDEKIVGREFTKIMMETQTGEMEEAPKEVYLHFNHLFSYELPTELIETDVTEEERQEFTQLEGSLDVNARDVLDILGENKKLDDDF